MNRPMVEFALEVAMFGIKASSGSDIHFANFNPYHQWPSTKYYRDIELRRYGPHGKPVYYTTEAGGRYTTYPSLERNALGPMAMHVARTPLFMAMAIPASLAIGLSYLHGDDPNYPWSPRKNQQRNNPTQLYLQN